MTEARPYDLPVMSDTELNQLRVMRPDLAKEIAAETDRRMAAEAMYP